MYEIEQIISADGWYAAYEGEAGELVYIPLLCLALVRWEHDGSWSVEGIDTDDEGAQDLSSQMRNFKCLMHESQIGG